MKQLITVNLTAQDFLSIKNFKFCQYRE